MMAFISAFTLIYIVIGFHSTVSYLLLTSPGKIATNGVVQMLGESMGFVLHPHQCFYFPELILFCRPLCLWSPSNHRQLPQHSLAFFLASSLLLTSLRLHPPPLEGMLPGNTGRSKPHHDLLCLWASPPTHTYLSLAELLDLCHWRPRKKGLLGWRRAQFLHGHSLRWYGGFGWVF